MDDHHFDVLTKTLVSGIGSRRAALRLLTRGALGVLAARFGDAELAAAKTRRKRQDRLRAEGGGNRKKDRDKKHDKKGKKDKKHTKKREQPQSCAACTATGGRCCTDGSCAAHGTCCPDEKRCGGGCIAASSCCPDTEKTCPDGSCRIYALCCFGEKMCAHGSCVAQTQCCPDESPCSDGSCPAPGACCRDEVRCADGSCVEWTVCCPGQKQCPPNGSCVAQTACCPDQWQCADGSCVAQDQCCPGEKRCADGSCISEDVCCADAIPPLCPEPGQEPLCCHGEEVCRPYLTAPGCPAWPERAYDAVTCRCLCPNNTNDSLGRCCPLDYPTGSIGQDGHCCRWEDCGGYECSRCVCALGYSRDASGLCRRT